MYEWRATGYDLEENRVTHKHEHTDDEPVSFESFRLDEWVLVEREGTGSVIAKFQTPDSFERVRVWATQNGDMSVLIWNHDRGKWEILWKRENGEDSYHKKVVEEEEVEA